MDETNVPKSEYNLTVKIQIVLFIKYKILLYKLTNKIFVITQSFSSLGYGFTYKEINKRFVKRTF